MRGATLVSLTPLPSQCYKDSPFVLRLQCASICTRKGASVPDAAKPQTLPSEVEARFRDSSGSMHDFIQRSAQMHIEAVYAPDLLGGHRSHGNAVGGDLPESGAI